MKAKEKAKELVHRYDLLQACVEGFSLDNAKQCALIAVDEMIVQNGDIYLAMVGDKVNEYYVKMNSYLFEVKQEIINL